jgi:hypothetical protein
VSASTSLNNRYKKTQEEKLCPGGRVDAMLFHRPILKRPLRFVPHPWNINFSFNKAGSLLAFDPIDWSPLLYSSNAFL